MEIITHASIMPGSSYIYFTSLALKIVFLYHKSGKYVNTYLDGWW